MRVFLGFGNSELFFAGLCHRLTKGHLDRFRRKDGRAIVSFIILGQRKEIDLGNLAGFKTVEFSATEENLGKLTSPVRPKVKKEHHVTVIDPLGLVIEEDHGREKLVGLVFGILLRNCFAGQDFALCAFAVNDGIPGQLGPLPAFVAIHRVIAPDHGANTSIKFRQFVLHVVQIPFATRWRGVATVGDRVDHDVFTSGLASSFCQGNKLVLVTVDSSVRDETNEVEPVPPGLLVSLLENFIILQGVIRN